MDNDAWFNPWCFFLWSHWGFLSGQATEDGVNNWVRKISPALFHIYVANRTIICTIFYNDWPDVVLNLIMLLANQETRETHDDEQGDFFYKDGLVIVSFFMSTTVSYIFFYLMASAWHLLSEHLCITTFPPQLLIHHGFLHVDPPPPSPQKIYCFHIFIPFFEREIQKRN